MQFRTNQSNKVKLTINSHKTLSLRPTSHRTITTKSKLTRLTHRKNKGLTQSYQSLPMSKRGAQDQIPQDDGDVNTTTTAPTMVEVTVTADSRQSYHNKKYRGGENNKKSQDDQQQVKIELNSAQLSADAGLDATTPLRHTPYSKQLIQKKKDLWKTLTWMTKDIEQGYKTTNSQLKKAFNNGSMKTYAQYQFDQPHRNKHGIACVTSTVVPSPQQTGYRNKNEFTISYGIGESQDEIDIGFLCGRFSDGETRVGSPLGSLSCPEIVVEINRTVKRFLNTNPVAQKYTPWIKPANTGVLRLLTVRDCPVTKQLMLSLQINPISFTPDFNHLTQANPPVENFTSLPDDQKATIRKEFHQTRDAKELENIQTEAYTEFATAFRDFCIDEFYGGAIWRTTDSGFVPPHDTYDLVNENSTDLTMTQPPSYSNNFQWVSKQTYKPIPTIDDTTTVSEAGKKFSEKYNYSLASVIIQTHCGVANSADMHALQNCLFGSHFIYAQLSSLFFRVSISSFLQVNIKAATTLYNIARHWAMAPKHDFSLPVEEVETKYLAPFVEIEQRFTQALWDKGIWKTSITPTKDLEQDPDVMVIQPPPDLPLDDKPTVLFDVCCGTGTIGLLNSTSAKKVIGVDIVQSAIDDANANAVLNNVKDASFVCGPAEQVMESILKRYPQSDVERSVAVLDPPRNGLHTKVLAALRESSLQRIVYISCNQKTLADDVQRLVGPPSKSYLGQPFVPICALGVDLFPHTEHCEVVMLLERRPPGQGKHILEQPENTAQTETTTTTTVTDAVVDKTVDV
jgi:tRNA/tmRNA/rRNA uracil-C5-methylase (TrmA/RlmC/RlmD family)